MRLRAGEFEAEIERSPSSGALLYRYEVYKVGSGRELQFSGYAVELGEAVDAAKAHLERLSWNEALQQDKSR